ncbi:Protein of unknown function, partial [Cotesia congregata]
MSATEQPLLALLQWVGGDYDQTYTAGVPVDWIIDFNPETFDPENEDQDISYLVEWREMKKNKKPKKGWEVYDARVIKISRSLKSLDDEIKILDGFVSPFRPIQALERIQKNLKNPTKRNLEGEFGSSTKGQHDYLEQPGISGIQKKKKKRSNNQNQSVTEVDNDGKIGDNGQSSEVPPEIEPIEIGHEGSNVFVRREQWDTANSRDTFQSMGVSLVRALFDDETLLRSNYKGGKSKINKNAPQRPGLDPNIMTSIKEAVKRKFPVKFKQFVFGMAINNMMTEFRRKNEVADDME